MKQILIPVAIAAANLLAAGTANATVALCETLTGGGVTILECAAKGGGTYDVTNTSGFAIYSFAVSTQNDYNSKPFTNISGWNARYWTEESWDREREEGNFDETFGTADTGAYFFKTAPDSKSPILSDGKSWMGQFGFRSGLVSSNFVAYGSSGNVIAQSFTTAVPEPETYAMLLAGLGVLGFMGKRRKTS